MTGPAPWRRLAPSSASARLAGLAVLIFGLLCLALLVAAPLIAGIRAAEARATQLDFRAAALYAAAAERRAEAGPLDADGASLAAAENWLDRNAPRTDENGALLDLISGVRLLAAEAGVTLDAATPLERGDGGAFAAATPGLRVVTAEARIVADHDGLARFLRAIETAEPPRRAAALEISARSGGALDEAERLSVTVLIGALSRPVAGE